MPTINFSNVFDKQLRKASIKIKKAFRNRLQLFKNDKFHPLLNNHKLSGKLNGRRSINVTGDWRAIYSENEEIELLGTYSQLYG